MMRASLEEILASLEEMKSETNPSEILMNSNLRKRQASDCVRILAFYLRLTL